MDRDARQQDSGSVEGGLDLQTERAGPRLAYAFVAGLALSLVVTSGRAQAPPDGTARADALIASMTLEQKLQQIYNLPVLNDELQDEDPPCEFQPVGRHIEGIPELGIPTFRFSNGGTGIKSGDCLPEPTATAMPSNVAAAATFDPEVNYAWDRSSARSCARGRITPYGAREST